MPPPGPGKEYQLWFLPKQPNAAPVPGAVLRLEDGVAGPITVPAELNVAGAAISIEDAGGAQVPTDIRMVEMFGPL